MRAVKVYNPSDSFASALRFTASLTGSNHRTSIEADAVPCVFSLVQLAKVFARSENLKTD